MKKVFQRIICNGKGDCARAAIASLFDEEYDNVPDFGNESEDYETSQANLIRKYFESKGYDHISYVNRHPNDTIEWFKYVLRYDGGINGLFYASVPSQTFPDTSHAVIVNTELEIVHDPNPNGLALLLGPEDVESVLTVSNFLMDKNGICYGKIKKKEG